MRRSSLLRRSRRGSACTSAPRRGSAGAHLADVRAERVDDGVAELGEALRELRRSGRATARADRCRRAPARRTPAPAPMPIVGMRDLVGDARREVRRDRLEHDRERARLLERARVGEDLLGGVVAAALHLESAERVHALRREPDVPDDRECPRARCDGRARRPPRRLRASRSRSAPSFISLPALSTACCGETW